MSQIHCVHAIPRSLPKTGRPIPPECQIVVVADFAPSFKISHFPRRCNQSAHGSQALRARAKITSHFGRRGARLTALLVGHISRYYSLLAPCQTGALTIDGSKKDLSAMPNLSVHNVELSLPRELIFAQTLRSETEAKLTRFLEKEESSPLLSFRG